MRRNGLVWLAPVTLLACTESEEPAPRERPATRVEVELASKSTIVDRIQLHAEIQASQRTRVAAGSLGGKAERVAVDDGSVVRAGQVLVELSAGVARARLQNAEAALQAARASAERARKLRNRDLASSAAAERTEVSLAQAEANAQLARAQFDDAVIKAPHAGVVAKRHISLGEQSAPGMPLFDLVDMREAKIVAQMPQRDVRYVRAGSDVTVTVDAWPEERFEATVRRVGAVAAQFSRTFDLEVRIMNKGGKLRPGMLARVEVVRQKLDDVVAVRRDALLEDERGTGIFIVAGDVAQRRPVTSGPVDGDRVAIIEGVALGDQVVVVGQRMLVDGETVKVVREHRAGAEVAESTQPATEPSVRP